MKSKKSNSSAIPLNIAVEKSKLQYDLDNWFNSLKDMLANIPDFLDDKVNLLSRIRKTSYEELNQLQHVRLILNVAEMLEAKYQREFEWYWHPRQTSHPDFADLTGKVDGIPFVYAEVTTSLSPVGTIDMRMKTTLESLSKKQATRYYYVVLTDKMYNRAISKLKKITGGEKITVYKNSWEIEDYSDEFKAELDKRYEEYLKDGITIPAEVVHKQIREMRSTKRQQEPGSNAQ